MKKILFVVDRKITFSEAPPSRFLYIARSLKEKTFDVEIIGRKGENVKDLRLTQVSGTKHVARLRILLITYAKILTRASNSIILRGGLLAFFLLPLKILNTKFILDFHGWLYQEIGRFYEKTLYNRFKVAFYHLIERMAVRHSNVIVCNNRRIRNLLGADEKIKSIILEDGVDIREAERLLQEAEEVREETYDNYPIRRGKPLIGFLGNWGRRMDMETMFKGAKMAEVNLVVVGEGPNLEGFRKRWDNVLFTGRLPRQEALKIIHLCNVVMSPYREGYVFSTRKGRDYLSFGKPIIMADVKGREPYFVPNKNVLLYKPGDAKDLAEKIIKLLSDKKLQKIIKTNNIRLSHRFDWKTLVEQSGIIKLIE